MILEVAAKSGTAADVLLKQQPFAEPGMSVFSASPSFSHSLF